MDIVTIFEIEYEVNPHDLTLTNRKTKSEEILTTDSNGNTFVYLDDHGKRRKIDFGLIILYLNHQFFLPFEHWDKIKVGFLDDKTCNFASDNLYLIYPEEPIEHEFMDGFYYIPGFELNCINEKGIIYRIPQSDIITPVFESNEKYADMVYPYYRVNINNSKISTRYVHRMLGLVFKNLPAKYPLLHIDHIDGIKSNFSLDNLEWVTPSENNIRAVMNAARTDNKVVLMKDISTLEIRTFRSQSEAANVMGVQSATISSYLMRGGIYQKRYVFKIPTDPRSWEEVSGLDSKVVEIKARHVLTGEIISVTGINNAIKMFKSSSPAIMKQLKDKRVPRKLLNGYEIKDINDFSNWHSFTVYDIEVFNMGLSSDTPVFEIIDLNNDTSTIVYGIEDALKITGVVKRTLIVVAKRAGVIAGKYKVIKLK